MERERERDRDKNSKRERYTRFCVTCSLRVRLACAGRSSIGGEALSVSPRRSLLPVSRLLLLLAAASAASAPPLPGSLV
jgi:hypothetical protein